MNEIGSLGVILLLALAAGHLVKILRVPEVTGYLVAGVILGPSVLGLVTQDNLAALEAFSQHMPGPNQLNRLHGITVTAAMLLEPLVGPITENGVRWNLHVGVRYLEAWLGGSGAEPIHNLMEDLATSEISRSQLWQWLRYAAKLDDGRPVTAELYDRLLAEELAKIREEYGNERFEGGHFEDAVALFMRMSKSREFDEFLSLPAYELLP